MELITAFESVNSRRLPDISTEVSDAIKAEVKQANQESMAKPRPKRGYDHFTKAGLQYFHERMPHAARSSVSSPTDRCSGGVSDEVSAANAAIVVRGTGGDAIREFGEPPKKKAKPASFVGADQQCFKVFREMWGEASWEKKELNTEEAKATFKREEVSLLAKSSNATRRSAPSSALSVRPSWWPQQLHNSGDSRFLIIEG